MPPDELRRRITDCVDQHIDHGAWSRLQRVEEIEQESIASWTHSLAAGGAQ